MSPWSKWSRLRLRSGTYEVRAISHGEKTDLSLALAEELLVLTRQIALTAEELEKLIDSLAPEKQLAAGVVLDRYQKQQVRLCARRVVLGVFRRPVDPDRLPEADYYALLARVRTLMMGFSPEILEKVERDAYKGAPNPLVTDVNLAREFGVTPDIIRAMPEAERSLIVAVISAENTAANRALKDADATARGVQKL